MKQPMIMMLQTLIESLTLNGGIHICINDISGILTQTALKLSYRYTIHSKPFCMWAKSTGKSNIACVDCKMRTIKKVLDEKTPFVGRCVFGVSEIVFPVEINGIIMAVIYLGNLTDDIVRLEEVILRRAQKFNLPTQNVPGYLKEFCSTRDFGPYMKMARLVCDVISILYDKSSPAPGTNHWLVHSLKTYAEEHFNTDISISLLSKFYYFNENYIGRVFKKQTGKTFASYLNGIRLKKSLAMLRDTDYSILQISILAGFNNVSYFNRLFKKSMGVSPSDFRKSFH